MFPALSFSDSIFLEGCHDAFKSYIPSIQCIITELVAGSMGSDITAFEDSLNCCTTYENA